MIPKRASRVGIIRPLTPRCLDKICFGFWTKHIFSLKNRLTFSGARNLRHQLTPLGVHVSPKFFVLAVILQRLGVGVGEVRPTLVPARTKILLGTCPLFLPLVPGRAS